MLYEQQKYFPNTPSSRQEVQPPLFRLVTEGDPANCFLFGLRAGICSLNDPPLLAYPPGGGGTWGAALGMQPGFKKQFGYRVYNTVQTNCWEPVQVLWQNFPSQYADKSGQI